MNNISRNLTTTRVPATTYTHIYVCIYVSPLTHQIKLFDIIDTSHIFLFLLNTAFNNKKNKFIF